MTASFDGPTTTLNGTTWVQVASAPGSGEQKEIYSIIVMNKDTVSHTYKGRKVKGAGSDNHFTVTVDPGLAGQLLPNSAVVLKATDETYEVSYEATMTTTESKVEVAIFKVP